MLPKIYDIIMETVAAVAAAAGVGAMAVPAIGAAAGALVPAAMAAFGTIVPGVGTLHAVGGIAATLQSTSAALVSTTASAVGALIGAAFGWK